MIEEIKLYSYKHQLTHVPSALSMLTYIDAIFSEKFIVPYRDRIVLGKPFGSQAYYLVWNKLGYLDEIENLSVGVKHSEIPFVDYGEETMGNALGVAIGIAIAQPKQTIWVNLTDATLQMGSTLEALQYIGHNNIKNIVVTVDFNNMQVTGETGKVLTVTPIINMCREYNWGVYTVDGHNSNEIKTQWKNSTYCTHPTIFFYKTIKGFGINYMQNDPVYWHYKPIEHI